MNFDLNQKVPTHLAFAIMLILSLVLAWYSVTTAEKIVKVAPESKSFNMEKRNGAVVK